MFSYRRKVLFQVSVPATLPISLCISALLKSHLFNYFFFYQKRFERVFLQSQKTDAKQQSKYGLSNDPITRPLLYQREKKPQFLNSHSLMLWVSQMSILSAQPFHAPTSNFTFSALKTRFNKPFRFTVRPYESAVWPHDLHFTHYLSVKRT